MYQFGSLGIFLFHSLWLRKAEESTEYRSLTNFSSANASQSVDVKLFISYRSIEYFLIVGKEISRGALKWKALLNLQDLSR